MDYTKQQGVALLTALLIVAIATVVSVHISSRLQLDIRRTANMISTDQASMYTLAAEDWARRILKEDRINNQIDHLNESWATELLPIPVEGGSIEGKLYDLQGCFNLNSLHVNGNDNTLAVTRFQSLLASLNLNSTVTQSILDWLDEAPDTHVPDGAEDGYYMYLPWPYRTANAPIFSPSELRLIKGFEGADTYNTLITYICAFGKSAPINVNTAPKEVIESLGTNINGDDIVRQRESDAFDDINDFINRNSLQTILPETQRGELSVSTDFFLLHTQAIIGSARTVMYSVIERDTNGDTRILSRSFGAY